MNVVNGNMILGNVSEKFTKTKYYKAVGTTSEFGYNQHPQ